LAVSQKVIPRSRACRKNGTAASYGMGQPSRPLSPSPKLIVPMATRLTLRPEDPKCVYSIALYVSQSFVSQASSWSRLLDRSRFASA
jgi:hypothetical protein